VVRPSVAKLSGKGTPARLLRKGKKSLFGTGEREKKTCRTEKSCSSENSCNKKGGPPLARGEGRKEWHRRSGSNLITGVTPAKKWRLSAKKKVDGTFTSAGRGLAPASSQRKKEIFLLKEEEESKNLVISHIENGKLQSKKRRALSSVYEKEK